MDEFQARELVQQPAMLVTTEQQTSFSTVPKRRGSCLAASPPLYKMATIFIPREDCLFNEEMLRRPWNAVGRARESMDTVKYV